MNMNSRTLFMISADYEKLVQYPKLVDFFLKVVGKSKLYWTLKPISLVIYESILTMEGDSESWPKENLKRKLWW